MALRLASALCASHALPQGRLLEGLDKKMNDLIGIRTHDLPSCSTVPQPTMLPLPQYFNVDLSQIVSI
jgi:hypothetical protein